MFVAEWIFHLLTKKWKTRQNEKKKINKNNVKRWSEERHWSPWNEILELHSTWNPWTFSCFFFYLVHLLSTVVRCVCVFFFLNFTKNKHFFLATKQKENNLKKKNNLCPDVNNVWWFFFTLPLSQFSCTNTQVEWIHFKNFERIIKMTEINAS